MRAATTRPRRVFACAALVLATAPVVRAAGTGSPDDSAATGATAPDEAEIERVLALSDDVAYGEYLAGECAACHGVRPGETSEGNAVPVVAGLEASRIAGALLEYRSGRRSNTTMGDVAGALGDEEIAVLARYLSSLAER